MHRCGPTLRSFVSVYEVLGSALQWKRLRWVFLTVAEGSVTLADANIDKGKPPDEEVPAAFDCPGM